MRQYQHGRAPLLAIMALVLLVGLTGLYLLLRTGTVTPPEPTPPSAPPEKTSPAPVVVPTPTKTVTPPSPTTEGDGKRQLMATVSALVEEGRALVDEKRFEEAVVVLEKAAALLRENQIPADAEGDALLTRAKDSFERRRRAERERLFDEAVREMDSFRKKDDWDGLVSGLEKIKNDFPEFAKEIDPALREAHQYQTDARNSCERQVRTAKEHRTRGESLEAVRCLRRATAIYPGNNEIGPLKKEILDEYLASIMVRIPGGSAVIGDDREEDEKPRRSVSHEPFAIDRNEVTNEIYELFVVETDHPSPKHWNGRSCPKGKEKHPVVGLSRADAAAFAAWAGKRLPTAEEWEIAARYIDGRTWPWGDTFPEEGANVPCNSVEYARAGQLPGTLAVGSLASGATPLGVHDMAGNVWEWTATDRDGSAVVKGGSFMTPRAAVRCANILVEDPEILSPDLGFRCVR